MPVEAPVGERQIMEIFIGVVYRFSLENHSLDANEHQQESRKGN